MTRNRIARAAAVLAAVAVLSALGTDAALAEKTATHWTIDRDTVRLSPSGSTFRLDGTLEHFDDGEHIRSVLTAQFAGTDSVDVVWTFRDGTTFVHGFAGGAARTETLRSIDVAPDDDVVRAEVFYFRGSSEESQVFFVGDSPDSLGQCARLDRDTANIGSSPNPHIESTIVWSCRAAGEVRAAVVARYVTVAGHNNQRMTVTFRHSDGTVREYSVQSSSTMEQQVALASDSGKRARSVTIRLGLVSTRTTRTVNFGDDA